MTVEYSYHFQFIPLAQADLHDNFGVGSGPRRS